MIRNEKRSRVRLYKKELEKLGKAISRAQKLNPKDFELFESMDDTFRVGKYPDAKLQRRYDQISDMVNRSFALCDLIEELQPTSTVERQKVQAKNNPRPQS